MKTKLNIKRGGAFALAIFSAFCLLPSAFTARALEFYQGIYIDGSTNTTTVNLTNCVRSVVWPSTTNTYNLSATTLFQGNTNQFPAVSLAGNTGQGFNRRYLFLSGQVQCSAANSGLETFRISGSGNASTNWITLATFTVTCNGTTPVPFGTNIDTLSFPYVCLQTLENTNATVTLTNTFNPPVSKTSL